MPIDPLHSETRGQEPGRTYRVGWLSGLPHDAPTHVALYDGLSRLGFVDGQNLQIDGLGFGLLKPNSWKSYTIGDPLSPSKYPSSTSTPTTVASAAPD